MTHGPYTDIDFVLSGSNGRGDFIGISGSALDKAGIGVFTCESGSVNFLSKSAGTMLNVYNGPYQYPSWQQVRNSYNPIVRKLARESLLTLAQTTIPIGPSGDERRAIRGGVICYKEPVVSENSKPIRHVLEVQPNINQPTITTSSFTYTHDNNLSSFTDVRIRDRLGINISDDDSIYKNISQLYLNLAEINSDTNPVRKFVELEYGEVLYPAPTNAFLNRTRSRVNYEEVPGLGSDGYDRIFGHQRTFFKENEIRTLGVAHNSQDYNNFAPAGDVEYSSSFTLDGFPPSDNFYWDTQSGMQCAQGDPATTPVQSPYGPYCFTFGCSGDTLSSVPERYLQFKTKMYNSSDNPIVGVTFDVFVISSTAFFFSGFVCSTGMDANLCCPPGTPTDSGFGGVRIQYKPENGSWTDFPEDGHLDAVIPTGFTPADVWTEWTASVDLSAVPGVPVNSAVDIRLAMVDSIYSYGFLNSWGAFNFQRLQITGSTAISSQESLNFNPMATDGIRSFANSSSYRYYDGELMSDTDETMFTNDPTPSLAFTEQTHLANESGSIAVLSDYVETLTEQISGKNPWYNTYGKYEEDIRGRSKSMSLVPEFRMSDFVEYYLVDEGGNFRARNDKFLLLDGGNVTASADFESSSVDLSFISEHVASSNPSSFTPISTDHADTSNITRIELTCKGIKKLLPYNGFYPQNRTIQLGNLLSQSLGPHITGSKSGDTFPGVTSIDYYPQALQGLLKPLMSPGILYNSIKSGIAVDYPIYTGTVPGIVEGSIDRPSDFILSRGPNYRLPFESLLNLKGRLPEGPTGDKNITLVSSFSTFLSDISTEEIFRYSFAWDGEKSSLFELAMHNFLAETVDFFLENGKLTSYKSQVQPTDGYYFETGPDGDNKTYYMDVVLRDTVEMNKFVEYSSLKTVVERSIIQAVEPVADGWYGKGNAVSVVEGGTRDEGLYALVGAPKTLPAGKTARDPADPSKDGGAFLYQNKLDSNGWKFLQSFSPHEFGLTAGESSGYARWMNFGSSVSMLSGTEGLILACAAPDAYTGEPVVIAHQREGAIVLIDYYSPDNYVGNVISASLSGSIAKYGQGFGHAVSMASGTDGIYIVCGAPFESDFDCAAYSTGCFRGGAYLFHSSSTRPDWSMSSSVSHFTQSLSSISFDQWGAATDIVVGPGTAGASLDDTLYFVIGTAHSYGHAGTQASLYRKTTTVGFQPETFEYQILTASDTPTPGAYSRDAVALVSGTGGIHCVIGANTKTFGGASACGAVYIYHSQSGEPFNIPANEYILTSSNPIEQENFGCSLSVLSGGSGLTMLVGADSKNGSLSVTVPPHTSGSAYFVHSNSAGTSSQYVTPGVEGDYFGAAGSLISSSYLDVQYGMIGSPSGTLTLSGSGIAYLYTGTVGSMTNLLQYSGIATAYREDGKLFGMALGQDYDPAYCAYTPPYMYGEAIARLSYTPDIEGPKSLDQILGGMRIENILTLDESRVAITGGIAQTLLPVQDENKMTVDASVNMFGKFYEPGVTYDAATNTATSINQGVDLNPSWVISSRFESPVLDTENDRYRQLYTSFNPLITGTFAWEPKVITEVKSGLSDPTGMALDTTNRKMYWSETAGTEGIYRADLNGSDTEILVATPGDDVRDIALDIPRNKMYYTLKSGGDVSVFSSSLEGTDPVELADTGVGTGRGIAVDGVGGMVYWTDSSKSGIYRMPVAGTSSGPIETLIDDTGPDPIVSPGGIALDVASGMMYFTDWDGDTDTEEAIMRAPMNGTGSQRLDVLYSKTLDPLMGFPLGIALDIPNRKVYWGDGDTDKIYRIGMDGEPCCTEAELVVDIPPGGTTMRYIDLDLRTREVYWTDTDDDNIQKTQMDLYTRTDPRTIWSSYSKVPKGDKGVYLELKESFPQLVNTSPSTGSLLQKCGFTIPEQSQMKVGKVRESKEISEAIVAIPYFDNALFQEQNVGIPTEYGFDTAEKEITVALPYGGIEGKNFVRISPVVYESTKTNIEQFNVAVPADLNPIDSGVEIKNTTVSDMIKLMKKYIIPPNLDFVKYTDIDPFVMYIFEFKHTLEQQELTDIWQGVTPESALKMEDGEVVISHGFSQFQFFGNILDKKILGDMKFLIFKVKKKAKQNYYEITQDSTDDSRFNFTFQGNPIASAIDLGGSYNWPYDFFSLVEEAKVEAKYTLKNKPPPVPISEDESEGEG